MWGSRGKSVGGPLRGDQGPGPSGIRVRSQKRTVMNKGVAVVRGQRGAAGRLFGAMLLALSALFPAVGAAPPEIIRVHVPDAQAAGWFPAGTPLRMMAADRFESLLDSAIRGTTPAKNTIPPRLIRARHHARWNAGVLTGGSELVAELPDSKPAALALDPWTPMVLDRPGERPIVGALASGQTVLWLEPPTLSPRNMVVNLDWELRARSESAGRNFALGLPGDETSVLTLELPEGWIPIGPEGFREGPSPLSRAGFQTWRFRGRPGLSNLRLIDTHAGLAAASRAITWVGGPRASLRARASLPMPGSGNWKTDWSVQVDPRGLMQFTAVLDPGLELLDVTGPEVKEYQAVRQGASPG